MTNSMTCHDKGSNSERERRSTNTTCRDTVRLKVMMLGGYGAKPHFQEVRGDKERFGRHCSSGKKGIGNRVPDTGKVGSNGDGSSGPSLNYGSTTQRPRFTHNEVSSVGDVPF